MANVLVLVQEVQVRLMGRGIAGAIHQRRVVVISVGAKVTRLIVVSTICLLTSRIPSWVIVLPHLTVLPLSQPPPLLSHIPLLLPLLMLMQALHLLLIVLLPHLSHFTISMILITFRRIQVQRMRSMLKR